MKALILDRPGRADSLKMGKMPIPDPGPHDVRFQVKAVGLNPVDYKLAETGWPSWKWPHILGLDVADGNGCYSMGRYAKGVNPSFRKTCQR